MTSLHREDINPLDKAEAILREVATDEQKRGLTSLGLESQEQDVLFELLNLQLNPAPIDSNIFPMLSLVDDLKAAIRDAGLFGVHALALSKLSAKNLSQLDRPLLSRIPLLVSS